MSQARLRRIEEQLRAELAAILSREVRDPRVTGVSLTAARVARDLEHAQVFFTRLQGPHEPAAKALNHAAGFLRSQLAQRMDLRTVPKLTFVYDASIERGAHLSSLIDQAVAEDRLYAAQAPAEVPVDAVDAGETHPDA